MSNRRHRRHSTLIARLVAAILLAFIGASLAGCNAVQGVGRDITSIGETGQGWINGKT